jgi:chromosomal replication initiation ATPase DnaA
LKQTESTKSITRNFIQSIIKDHYEMIGKLEKLLDQFPVVERIARHKRRPAEEIINAVNEVFNTDCTEHSRRQRVADARHCAVYMLRQYTDLTLKEIGEQLGSNGHHTTILHSIKTCKNLIDIDEHFAEKYSQTKILLDSKLQLI